MVYAVISDIHGRATEMMSCLLYAMKNYPDAKFVFLGDYIDMFYEHIDTLKGIINFQKTFPETVVLHGNHEEYFHGSDNFDSIAKTSKLRDYHMSASTVYSEWMMKKIGGLNTVMELGVLRNESLTDYNKLVKFCTDLPYYYEDDNFIFTHAPICRTEDKPMDDYKVSDLLNNHKKVRNNCSKVNVHGHLHTEQSKPSYNKKNNSIDVSSSPSVMISILDSDDSGYIIDSYTVRNDDTGDYASPAQVKEKFYANLKEKGLKNQF